AGAEARNGALKFMDILLGPPTSGARSVGKTPSRCKRMKKAKRLKKKVQAKRKSGPGKGKSMRTKYDKFYSNFDKVGEDVGAYCERLRVQLLEQLESFGERLPPNTLDELIDELGGPDTVAEMTGRK